MEGCVATLACVGLSTGQYDGTLAARSRLGGKVNSEVKIETQPYVLRVHSSASISGSPVLDVIDIAQHIVTQDKLDLAGISKARLTLQSMSSKGG